MYNTKKKKKSSDLKISNSFDISEPYIPNPLKQNLKGLPNAENKELRDKWIERKKKTKGGISLPMA